MQQQRYPDAYIIAHFSLLGWYLTVARGRMESDSTSGEVFLCFSLADLDHCSSFLWWMRQNGLPTDRKTWSDKIEELMFERVSGTEPPKFQLSPSVELTGVEADWFLTGALIFDVVIHHTAGAWHFVPIGETQEEWLDRNKVLVKISLDPRQRAQLSLLGAALNDVTGRAEKQGLNVVRSMVKKLRAAGIELGVSPNEVKEVGEWTSN